MMFGWAVLWSLFAWATTLVGLPELVANILFVVFMILGLGAFVWALLQSRDYDSQRWGNE